MSSHVLQREQSIDLPVHQVFDFFGSAGNLARVTPPSLGFRFRATPPERLSAGATIRYRVRVRGVPIDWTTRISEWAPPHRFVDVQLEGPYRRWAHTHTFDAVDHNRTIMRDRIVYAIPLGPLGEVARKLFVEAQLRRIFDYREKAFNALLNGEPPPAEETGTAPAALEPLAAGLVAVALAAGALLWRRRSSLRQARRSRPGTPEDRRAIGCPR